jgi:hypothetical protein
VDGICISDVTREDRISSSHCIHYAIEHHSADTIGEHGSKCGSEVGACRDVSKFQLYNTIKLTVRKTEIVKLPFAIIRRVFNLVVIPSFHKQTITP